MNFFLPERGDGDIFFDDPLLVLRFLADGLARQSDVEVVFVAVAAAEHELFARVRGGIVVEPIL